MIARTSKTAKCYEQRSCDASLFTAYQNLRLCKSKKHHQLMVLWVYLKDGAWVSPFAKAFGPGLDIEKYIFAAFVVPKSLFEPVS